MEESLALVIEDNLELGRIFAEAVREAGFTTEVIRTGDKAMRRLAAVVPKLVILDLHLPGVTGAEILSHIRSDPRLQQTRVILATAEAREAEELDDRADLVLLKPVGYQQLRDLADRVGRSPGPVY